MLSFEFEIGSFVNFPCDGIQTLGRIENIKMDKETGDMSITISDGQHLFNVKPEDISKVDLDHQYRCEPCELKVSIKHDPVNHPSHYTDGKIEVIDFINDKKMNFNRGNVIKYVSRAGKKASKALDDKKKEIQDLEKAKFYLEDEIKRLKQALEDND